jgi:hypothetical protein
MRPDSVEETMLAAEIARVVRENFKAYDSVNQNAAARTAIRMVLKHILDNKG